MSQPIILYSHATGPNPWKVAIILEELGLKYEHKFVEMADLKKAPFEAVNPNGRSVALTSSVRFEVTLTHAVFSVPAIEDPNSGIVLWESGAIVEYLIGRLLYPARNCLPYSIADHAAQSVMIHRRT